MKVTSPSTNTCLGRKNILSSCGLLLMCGLWSFPTAGQRALSLEQALQIALQNNQGVKASEYQVEYFKEIKKTATDIGKMSAMWMHGQYNSIYQDNNLTLVQTLPFPTALTSQVKLGKEQVVGAEKDLQATKNELVFEVKSVYYNLLYTESLKALLLSQDSIYSDFVKASALRYSSGESNLLERTTAETQRMEIQNQIRQNEADILIYQARLQALLKSEGEVTASESLAKRALPSELDNATVADNPRLSYLRQQAVISERSKRVEVNRILPDITFGYFVQSLTGLQNVNGQDIYYNRSKAFQGLELGLAIPLWIGPNIARVRAAGFHENAARKSAEYYQTTLQGTYTQALRELDKNTSSLNYYEATALHQAHLILTQARKGYAGGEIGYVEYLQALKNANGIRAGYLQALSFFNQSVIKIEFLLGKL